MNTALQTELRSSKKYLPIVELEQRQEHAQLLGQQITVLVNYAGQLYQIGQGTVEMVNIDNEVEFSTFDGHKTFQPSTRQTISITVRR